MNVAVEQLFEALADESRRKEWLDVEVTVSKATPFKSVRMKLPDGTPVEAYLASKGAGKSAVQLQIRKLPSKRAAEQAKSDWADRLESLERLLTD